MDKTPQDHPEDPLPILKRAWSELPIPDPTPDDQPDLETVRVLEWVATAWHGLEIPTPKALPSAPAKQRPRPTPWSQKHWIAAASIAAAAIVCISLLSTSSDQDRESSSTPTKHTQTTAVAPSPKAPANPHLNSQAEPAATVVSGAVITPKSNGLQIQNGPVRLLLIQEADAQ